jgi:hypothetical protein
MNPLFGRGQIVVSQRQEPLERQPEDVFSKSTSEKLRSQASLKGESGAPNLRYSSPLPWVAAIIMSLGLWWMLAWTARRLLHAFW